MSAKMPLSAKLIDCVMGILPEGEFKGKKIQMKLWEFHKTGRRWVTTGIQGGFFTANLTQVKTSIMLKKSWRN